MMINKIASLLIILLLAACSDSDSDEREAVKPSLSSLWEHPQGLQMCSNNCHNSNGFNPGPPDLSSKELFLKNFINKKHPSSLNWGNIGYYYIKPGKSQNSSIMTALSASDAEYWEENISGFTASFNIHLENKSVPPEKIINALKRWIDEGAKNN